MKYFICQMFGFKHVILILLPIILICHPASAAVTLHPELSAGNTYTDNIDLTPENEEHDFITTVSPVIDISMTGRLSSLSLVYAPTYANYLRFPEFNTLRHKAELSTSRQISRTTELEFTNAYLYTEEPLYDTEEPITEIDTTVRQGREPYYTNTAAFTAINRFGPENSIEFGYEYYVLKNRGGDIEDRDLHTPRIILNYWPIPNKLGAESEISYTKRAFDISEDYNDISARLRITRRFSPHFDVYAEYTHEFTNYVAEGEDYQVYSPAVGFVWDEYFNSSLSGSFGYFFQDNEFGEDENGVVGMIQTTYAWERGTTFSVSGSAGYDRAATGAENLGFNTFYGVTSRFTHPLSRRLTTDFTIDYRRNIYTELEPEREDGIVRASANLTYQILSWMFIEANYTFRDLDSDIDANDYTENRATINVTLSPRQSVMLSR